MDTILTTLLRAERLLIAELMQTPMLLEIQRMIEQRHNLLEQRRTPMPTLPPHRLLCEMVHEAHAVEAWENEGGAVR